MKFKPTKLQRATEQLQKTHSFEARFNQQIHQLQTSPLALELAKILRETSLDALNTRLETLSHSLKQYLTPFSLHPVPELRQKAIECLFYEPQHANHPVLWTALLAYHDEKTTQRLAELLCALPTPMPSWTLTQTAIIKARTHSSQAALRTFWHACLTSNQLFQDMLSTINASPKLKFSTQAINDLLAYGTTQLWQQQGLSFLAEHFEKADNHHKTLACAQCYANYAHLPLNQALQDTFSKYFIDVVIRFPFLHTALHDTHHPAWRWYNKFINRDKASHFFNTADGIDTERFDFWDEYFNHLTEVTANERLHAIFLEFDTFGVIEFGKKGNAAYIYEIDDFHKIKETDQRIDDLKNKETRIASIYHRGNWKANARITIAKISLKRTHLSNAP